MEDKKEKARKKILEIAKKRREKENAELRSINKSMQIADRIADDSLRQMDWDKAEEKRQKKLDRYKRQLEIAKSQGDEHSEKRIKKLMSFID